MPFISVKAFPMDETVKRKTADAILEVFRTVWGAEPDWVTVAMEDIPPEDWDEKVVRAEIQKDPERIMILDGQKQYRGENMTEKERYQNSIFFPIGAPNDAFAKYFVGQSYLAPVSTEQIPIFNVTFEPGCRNNWHIHHADRNGGQMLICVGGRGWYQEWGKEAVSMTPGTVVNIPAGVKHWHGAAADSWFSHLAIEIPGENGSAEWCEPVSDEDYGKLK